MKITTTDTYPGQEYEVIGVLEANSTRAASFVKDSFAGIRDMFGGRSKAYDKVLSGVIQDAFEDLASQATRHGADAVIGTRSQLTNLGGSKMLAAQVIGTAIRFKKT